MGDVNTLLCLWSAELSKVFGLMILYAILNICSDVSMVQGC